MFKNGRLNGYARMIDPEQGYVFIGHFVDDVRQGYGEAYKHRGIGVINNDYHLVVTYKGNFKNNLYHGKGTSK
jgi:hypothetical protein